MLSFSDSISALLHGFITHRQARRKQFLIGPAMLASSSWYPRAVDPGHLPPGTPPNLMLFPCKNPVNFTFGEQRVQFETKAVSPRFGGTFSSAQHLRRCDTTRVRARHLFVHQVSTKAVLLNTSTLPNKSASPWLYFQINGEET